MRTQFLMGRSICRVVFAVSCAVLLPVMSGCGANGVVSPERPSQIALSVQGRVHGGQQPIYGATIGLWQAGTSGYGEGATNLMTSTVKTAKDGTFTITGDYTACTLGRQVYITAYGGDPSGAGDDSIDNTAIMLVAALGLCDNINSSTYISINEVTTAAAAFGLGQFFGGFGSTDGTGDLIGTSANNSNGLVNAFATTRNLADTTTGTPATTTPAANSHWLTGNDQQKLNTIANILAGCVNQTSSDASACTSLFSEVTPLYAPLSTSITATPAADTFQAAVYMSLNPTSTNSSPSATNMTTLFNQQSAFQPFAPALTTAPNDWTLAISYSGTGIDNVASAAVDANGDIWLVNGNNTGTNGGGIVVLNGGTGIAGGTVGVTGGQIGYYTSGTYGTGPTTASVNGPRSIAIDEDGYGWTGNNTGASSAYYIFKAASSGITDVYTVGNGITQLYGVAVDPATDGIFVTSSGNILSLSETAANGTLAANTASGIIGNNAGPGIVINGSSVAYVPNQGSSSLYEFNSSSTSAPTVLSGSPYSGIGTALYGAAIDGSGRVIMTNSSTTLTTVTGSGSSQSHGSITSSCLQSPKLLAVDGNNNIWVANNGSSSVLVNGTSTTAYTVCELDSAGNLISASAGYGPHNITGGRGIAIDLSGNVWVTSYVVGTPNTNVAGANVTEIVGAAVPVGNPIASAIKNGTLGNRP